MQISRNWDIKMMNLKMQQKLIVLGFSDSEIQYRLQHIQEQHNYN